MHNVRALLILAIFPVALAQAANWTSLRRIAQISSCAASMVDAASTLRPGLRELNPLLGSGQPNAGRIIGIKVGICLAPIIVAEWQLHRHGYNQQAERINFGFATGTAGLYSGLAVHNYRIRVEK